MAQKRAIEQLGTLVLRNEDLDRDRCRPQYAHDMLEDLRWFSLSWGEGPDIGGPYAPYVQSERAAHYLDAWRALLASGLIYPSPHSRRDVSSALSAPHDDDQEPIFPIAFRPAHTDAAKLATEPGVMNWRFRVPDGRTITFHDLSLGEVRRTAGVDFGDFLVWRKDGMPSYELAVVTDDHAMQISEVVRGEDLLTSTARQLLLYEALGWLPPAFYHCPLMRDEHGVRLAKRHGALSLRAMRTAGKRPEELREQMLRLL